MCSPLTLQHMYMCSVALTLQDMCVQWPSYVCSVASLYNICVFSGPHTYVCSVALIRVFSGPHTCVQWPHSTTYVCSVALTLLYKHANTYVPMYVQGCCVYVNLKKFHNGMFFSQLSKHQKIFVSPHKRKLLNVHCKQA